MLTAIGKLRFGTNIFYCDGTVILMSTKTFPPTTLVTLYNTILLRQDYETDTYLRQQWWDSRLAHPNLTSALDLADPRLVKAIWKPEARETGLNDLSSKGRRRRNHL